MSRPRIVAALLAIRKANPHGRCGTGHDPKACGGPSEAGTVIRCDCCRGNCPSHIGGGERRAP